MLGRALAPIVARFFERRPALFLAFLLLGAGVMGWVSALGHVRTPGRPAVLWIPYVCCAAYALASVWYAGRLAKGTARAFWRYVLDSLARTAA